MNSEVRTPLRHRHSERAWAAREGAVAAWCGGAPYGAWSRGRLNGSCELEVASDVAAWAWEELLPVRHVVI